MQYGECRCCRSKGCHHELHQEYFFNGQREVYVDMFVECFTVFLNTDVRLPTMICASCIDKLRDACTFRKLVLDTEMCLLNQLGEGSNGGFVNDALDPLEQDLKKEVYSEPDSPVYKEAYDMDMMKDELIPSENVKTLLEDNLIPGESELISRFESIKKLPSKKALSQICPGYFKFLEILKGKVIKANKIEILYKSSSERNIKNPEETNSINDYFRSKSLRKCVLIPSMSEKMAQTMNASILVENSNIAVFKNKTHTGFPCLYCNQSFNNINLLREHQREHSRKSFFSVFVKHGARSMLAYADVTNLQCTLCYDKIATLEQLKQHLVNKHNKKLYNQVTDRIIPFRLGDRESDFDCVICGKHFETFGALNRHMSLHYRHFICEKCGAGFITQNRFDAHNRVHVEDSRTCKDCNKVFPNKLKLGIHCDNVHRKLKKVRCMKCPSKFLDYFARQRHWEEKHGVEPILYKCKQCEKSFNRKHLLTCHIKRTHLEIKEFQCNECPFKCCSKPELRDHMYSHGEKGFVCSVCKKAFFRPRTLAVHMNIHRTDLRYSCHICGEGFVQSWSFKTHLKSHSLELGCK